MEHPFVKYLSDRDLIPPGASRHLARTPCEPIGMIAVNHGLLQVPQIDRILDAQRGSQERFGEIAVRMGFLTAKQVDLLVKIQEFRAAVAITEALALAGVLKYEDAVRYLGTYFSQDDEILSVIAND
jgi:hypothetical protein